MNLQSKTKQFHDNWLEETKPQRLINRIHKISGDQASAVRDMKDSCSRDGMNGQDLKQNATIDCICTNRRTRQNSKGEETKEKGEC